MRIFDLGSSIPAVLRRATFALIACAVTCAGAQDRSATRPLVPAASATSGSYYALVIGINDYAAPLPKLITPASDAKAIDEVLREKYGFHVQLLLDGDATRKGIITAINRYRNTLSPSDSLLIYYAGHGYADKDAGLSYWLPSGSDMNDPSSWVSAEDVTHGIRALAASHILIISDSCYSGGLAQSGRRYAAPAKPTIEQQVYLDKMLRQRSRTLMASGGDEPVADAGTAGHSVFAYPLLQGLAQPDQITFTAQHLFDTSIRVRVGGNARQTPLYTPIADSGDDGGDFVFVRTGLTPAEIAAAAHAVIPPSAAELEAMDEYKRGELMAGMQRYGEAISLLTSSCESGYFEACAYLGLMYANATGVPKDGARAAVLYRKACEGGSAVGCTRLGGLYDKGTGLTKDLTAAATFYRKGCEGKDASGCSNLGSMYAAGDGVAKDPAQAALLLHKACDFGDAQGCFNLALTLARGEVLPKDEPQAAALYRQACKSGLAEGCLNVGVMEVRGAGIAKDEPHAADDFRKACELGNARGCTNLGNLTADPAKAAELYLKACDAGDGVACVNLGVSFENGTGAPADKTRAATLYRQACEAHSALGCRYLGMDYENGTGIPKDKAQAGEAYRKGCDLKDKESCDAINRLQP